MQSVSYFQQVAGVLCEGNADDLGNSEHKDDVSIPHSSNTALENGHDKDKRAENDGDQNEGASLDTVAVSEKAAMWNEREELLIKENEQLKTKIEEEANDKAALLDFVQVRRVCWLF